jgi:hypothetical protein
LLLALVGERQDFIVSAIQQNLHSTAQRSTAQQGAAQNNVMGERSPEGQL